MLVRFSKSTRSVARSEIQMVTTSSHNKILAPGCENSTSFSQIKIDTRLHLTCRTTLLDSGFANSMSEAWRSTCSAWRSKTKVGQNSGGYTARYVIIVQRYMRAQTCSKRYPMVSKMNGLCARYYLKIYTISSMMSDMQAGYHCSFSSRR